MLTVLYPLAFLLVPVPLLVRWLMPPRVQSRPALRIPFLSRLEAAGAGREEQSTRDLWLYLFGNGVIWLLVLTALARPQWLEPPIERTVPTRDLLLLVDLSGSMDQNDFTDATGNKVTRLAAVKEVLGDFLARRQGDRVGLVVFGDVPFLQAPFTTDLELCQRLLDETAVGMAGQQTALGDAIGLGIQLLEDNPTPEKTMIALTDGNDTRSAVPPVEAARVAKDRQITIYTVAMGDPSTVGEEKLDRESLKAVANATGGESFLALNRQQLETIYDQLDEIETHNLDTVSHRPRRDLYCWPLSLVLLISLLLQLQQTLSAQKQRRPTVAATRLRVNTRTFELETGNQ